MRKPILYNSITGLNPPVLLLEGFPTNFVGTPGSIVTQQEKLASDRGYLKYLDVQFFDDGAAGASVNQEGNFTLAVGGQNVLENCGFANWDIESQLGKNKYWDTRIRANQNQTLQMQVHGRNNTTNIIWQMIAKYTTDAHENWLKKFPDLMNWKPGLKRKGYQLTQPIGSTTQVRLVKQLPRQNGEIIGVALAQAGNVDFIDQLQTLITVTIDGVEIIKNVCMAYFNTASGRDSYLNPIHIQPGSTMEVTMTPTSIGGIPVAPALETVVLNIDFYFGRSNDVF
jgi:hypothetical protein